MRTPARLGLTVAGLTAAVALGAGCSSGTTGASSLAPPSATTSASTSTATSPARVAMGGPVPEATSAPMDFDMPSEDAEPYPVWDQDSRDTAVAAAAAAMTAFARPPQGSDPDAWWAALAPLLTPTAQQTYALVDPAEVPPTRLTGPGELVEPGPDASAFLATVHVPTDAGTYEVLLARTGHDAPWLAERLTPPPELSGPPTAPPAAPPAEPDAAPPVVPPSTTT